MSKREQRAQVLVGATVLVLVLMIFVPLLVQWGREESHWAVKEQRAVSAFNLAEAAIDRGLFKLKSSTGVWGAAAEGTVVAGYDFDALYTDIEGGAYRIQFSSGPIANHVTVLGEARDERTGQTKAIRAVFANVVSPGAMISGGVINYQDHFECHWGPIYSLNAINLAGWAAGNYFPRKFSKQVVTPRDLNGLSAPNTDNLEWWSGYNVPDLPQLDFTTMRTEAAGTGTLNYYTSEGPPGVGKCVGWGPAHRCSSAGVTMPSHHGGHHFFCSYEHPQAMNQRTWYWDGDLTLSGTTAGAGCHGVGIYGTVIVRGNLTMDSPVDCYSFTNNNVPAEAWKEYETFDTAAANEYPADTGYHTNATSYVHGGAGSGWPGGHPDAKTDVGIRGFVYAGGNMVLNNCSDIAGAAWVVGNITNNAVGDRVLIFYDPTDIEMALLNVVVVRESWDEIPPSLVPWS